MGGDCRPFGLDVAVKLDLSRAAVDVDRPAQRAGPGVAGVVADQIERAGERAIVDHERGLDSANDPAVVDDRSPVVSKDGSTVRQDLTTVDHVGTRSVATGGDSDGDTSSGGLDEAGVHELIVVAVFKLDCRRAAITRERP